MTNICRLGIRFQLHSETFIVPAEVNGPSKMPFLKLASSVAVRCQTTGPCAVFYLLSTPPEIAIDRLDGRSIPARSFGRCLVRRLLACFKRAKARIGTPKRKMLR